MEMVKKKKATGVAKQLFRLIWGQWMKNQGLSYSVIGRKQLASYFSYDFQILKVKCLFFTEEK